MTYGEPKCFSKMKKELIDKFGRKVRYLRLSITDRCNFKCFYCKPIKDFKYIPHEKILRYEDLLFLSKTLKEYGIEKIRLTGGEPFVRKGFLSFLRELSKIFDNVFITTNGYFLKESASELKKIGIKSINISLDTLRKERFEKITKVDALNRVLEGIEMSLVTGLRVKINSVLMKSTADEIIPLIEYAAERKIPIRFIELMPISSEVQREFLSEDSAKILIRKKFNLLPLNEKFGAGPSRYFKIKEIDGVVGFISALTHNFCDSCDKIRITSDGKLRVCLALDDEVSIKEPVIARDKNALILTIKKALEKKPLSHNMSIGQIISGKDMYQIGG